MALSCCSPGMGGRRRAAIFTRENDMGASGDGGLNERASRGSGGGGREGAVRRPLAPLNRGHRIT